MKRCLYILMLLAFLLPDAYAQDPWTYTINKSTGLPSNSVYDIFQDSKGFIWIAHNEGLTRYDGFEFKTFSNATQSSRAGSQISEDKYGRIWYANFDNNLYYVEHDSLHSFPTNNLNIYVHYGIIGNTLLLPQREGLCLYDLATLKRRKIVPLNVDSLGYTMRIGDRFYIISTAISSFDEAGAVRHELDSDRGTVVPGLDGKPMYAEQRAPYSAFYQIVDGSAKQLFSLNGIPFIQKYQYTGDRYWMLTTSGAWAFNTAGHAVNGGKPFFPEKNISSVIRDREGNFWFGTINEGILFVPDLNTKMMVLDGTAPRRMIHVNGKVVISTRSASLYTYDGSAVPVKRFQDAVLNEMSCFQYDPVRQHFFIGAQYFKTLDADFNIISTTPLAIKDIVKLDGVSYAFAGSSSSGLYIHDTAHKASTNWLPFFDKFRSINVPTVAHIVQGARSRAVAFDSAAKKVFFGTAKGLLVMTYDSLWEMKCAGTAVAAEQLVWYGRCLYVITAQHGVLAFKEGIEAFVPGGVAQGDALRLKVVAGKLLLIRRTGISVLDQRHVFEALKTDLYVAPETINDVDMLGDTLLLTTDQGLLIKPQTSDEVRIVAPVFYLNYFKANGQEQDHRSTLTLDYDETDIEINYSIIAFRSGRNYPLYYRINDGRWLKTQPETRTLRLAALSPGNYTIHFRLGENGTATAISFVIEKPFWLQWWFIALCAFVFFVGGYSYYRWQTGLLKRKNALLVDKVVLEQELRKSTLTSIKSQMNPHFFYNALNTIQSFIFSDDKRNASTYLVKLSKLTRMILEMSEKESVSLQEEITALTLYLELELMRFDDNFEFHVHVGDRVDTEFIRIPSMIVQPYVENAVKHGLLHARGEKRLFISFERNDDLLKIVVDDNGIGRKRSEELNRTRNVKHQSFASEANSKRVEILNKGRSRHIGVEYIDKENDGGTTVIILIPLVQ